MSLCAAMRGQRGELHTQMLHPRKPEEVVDVSRGRMYNLKSHNEPSFCCEAPSLHNADANLSPI